MSKENVGYLITQLPNQNRATIRALWRKSEKIILSWSPERQKMSIYKAFCLLEKEEEKLNLLNLVFTNGRKIFDKISIKIEEEIWK